MKLNIGVPCPQWSPDGSRLAYLTYPVDLRFTLRDDAVAELRVSTLNGQERVINSGRPAHPEGPFAWSPDGDTIAYVGADGVWAAALDGGAPFLVWRTDGTPTAVSWSSRGDLAVTVRTPVAVEGGYRDALSLHVVDVDTGTERTLAETHVYDYVASWSPDGSRLAFVGDDGHIRMSDRDGARRPGCRHGSRMAAPSSSGTWPGLRTASASWLSPGRTERSTGSHSSPSRPTARRPMSSRRGPGPSTGSTSKTCRGSRPTRLNWIELHEIPVERP